MRALESLSMRIAVAGATVYLGWIFLGRSELDRRSAQGGRPGTSSQASEFDRIYGGSEVKILQFYARDSAAIEGQGTVLCYGVLNAKSVRISPPVGGVDPAITRCVAVAPERETEYTLTAEGRDGRTVSASFVLPVRADPDTLPKIDHFRVVSRTKDYLGRPIFKLSYADRNAEEVSISPPVFAPMKKAPYGQFYVAPRETTTYTLTVKGKFGHTATRQLTVEVPPG